MVVAVSACSDSPTAAERRITSIELQPRKIVVDDVEPVQLDAIVRDQLGQKLTTPPSGMRVHWRSTDPDIATVDEYGLVTPVSSGSANIIAELTERTSTDSNGMISVSSSASAVTVNSVPYAIQHVSGSGQTGPAGAKLPNDIVVRPVTKTGAIMPGIVLDFIANPGAGSFAPSGATVAADGTARAAWTLGPASGPQTASVRARKGNAALTVSATASGSCLAVAPTGGTLTSIGATLQLTPTTSASGTVAWASSNSAVATVSSTGLVTAVSNGSATITATLAPCVPATASITVAQAIASVTTDPATASIQTGQTTQLSATAKDANSNTINGVSFAWASNNAAIATVNASGLVTGVAAGSANITATAGGKSDTSTVTVSGAVQTIASVTTTPASVSIGAGQTTQLSATATDTNGATMNGVSFAWASDNAAVATVNANGLVTGVAAGSANITATAGGKSDTSAVTVTAAPPAGAIATVTIDPPSASIADGQTVQLTATAKDANGTTITGATFGWSSPNPSVAVANATGLVIGASPGTATITASAGGKLGSATITVTPAPPPSGGGTVATVTVSPASKSVEVNQTVQLDAVARDAGATILPGAEFTWVSSNPGVATVDANGLLTGKAIGSTTVTATSGGISSNSAITVTPASVFGGGDPANFNTIKQGIRPRGFGAGTYSLKSPAAGGIAYYVATDGDDANPGTRNAPFRTINRAAQTAIAGDVVIIRDGTYQESVRIMTSGNSGAPIVFQAQNRGGVVLTGGQYVFEPYFYIGQVGDTQSYRYITLKGLIFNAYGSNGDSGVAVRAFWGWAIEDCRFDNAAETALKIVDSNIRVERTTFENNYVHAFDVYGGFSGGTSATDPAFRPVENLLIKDVVMRNNHTRNVYGAAVSSTRVAKISVTRGTIVDNVESYENYGSGMWLDNKNTNYTVRNSYFHDNNGVNSPTGVTAYDAGRGLYIEKNWGTGLVENNVMSDNDGAGIVIVSSNDIMFNNNLVVRNEQAIQLLAITGTGYENFLMRNLTFRNTYMKAWRSQAAVWARGGDFSLGPAGMGISLDFDVYDNTNNPVQLAAWPAPLYGASTIAQMQTKFGWEFNGSLGTIPD